MVKPNASPNSRFKPGSQVVKERLGRTGSAPALIRIRPPLKPVHGAQQPARDPQPEAALADPLPVQQQRSIDGSGNNLNSTSRNAVGSSFMRLGPARFAGGNGLLQDLPNARTVSNLVVAGQGETPNREGLSGLMYAWGQFLDHDINLTRADELTSIAIEVPAGDPLFSGSIALTRAVVDPSTGLALNHVSGWIDGSMVYGSDAATAASLRGADGTLLTSAGNNLPISGGAFLAGDIRAQENPDLTALQVLFVREHNRQVAALRQAHPSWSADQLYQQARAVVTAEIARITYSEFLPHLLGPGAITPYRGYNPNADARLSEEFAGAAFRFGHSIVSANLEKISETGTTLGTPVSLRDAFHQTSEAFAADGGADGLLRHLAADRSNALDVHLVDDLRNFLFGPSAGLDLAAINIQRGRDLGLGSLNDTRRALGLAPYTSFEQLSADASVRASLQAAYGSIDRVELWIGGLAEDHVNGGMVGETFGRIVAQQFQNLRDGDRFWYQNQGFDPKTLQAIETTTLADLILRNTNTQHLQADAFVYTQRRSGAAAGGVGDPLVPQLVVGADREDWLTGGTCNDMLIAGAGLQHMRGGGGADTFVFSKTGIAAEISDFTPGIDRLRFETKPGFGGLGAMQCQIAQRNGNVSLAFGGDTITLLGLSAQQLRPGDICIV